jgi:hypothetical protein
MYINIEDKFMFSFFPDISNEQISIESANNIIKFLLKYKEYYDKKYLSFYNTKTFICSINYEDNKWLVLDQKYNIFEINFGNTQYSVTLDSTGIIHSFVVPNSDILTCEHAFSQSTECLSKTVYQELTENDELFKIVINELNELINAYIK